jgi:hypothetical protein
VFADLRGSEPGVRRYLAKDVQSEWAARGAESSKFCEMQVYLSDVLTFAVEHGRVLGGAIAVP